MGWLQVNRYETEFRNTCIFFLVVLIFFLKIDNLRSWINIGFRNKLPTVFLRHLHVLTSFGYRIFPALRRQAIVEEVPTIKKRTVKQFVSMRSLCEVFARRQGNLFSFRWDWWWMIFVTFAPVTALKRWGNWQDCYFHAEYCNKKISPDDSKRWRQRWLVGWLLLKWSHSYQWSCTKYVQEFVWPQNWWSHIKNIRKPGFSGRASSNSSLLSILCQAI